MWPNQLHTKQRPKQIRLMDIVKASSVSTVAYSNKFRLYLLITTDFKFIFLNELNIMIKPPMDMPIIRLVNHAQFYDEQNLLVTGGINGVFIFNFDY